MEAGACAPPIAATRISELTGGLTYGALATHSSQLRGTEHTPSHSIAAPALFPAQRSPPRAVRRAALLHEEGKPAMSRMLSCGNIDPDQVYGTGGRPPLCTAQVGVLFGREELARDGAVRGA